MLKNTFDGRSTLQIDTLELLPIVMEGALRKCRPVSHMALSKHQAHTYYIEYIGQLQVIHRQMEGMSLKYYL